MGLTSPHLFRIFVLMQTALVIITVVAAAAYIVYKISRQFTAKGCEKGCGSCSNIQIPNKR
jgi:hypothetical protein